MVYQPLAVPVRENKAIETKKNIIQISGITNDKIAFTVWSDTLEAQKWVSKIEIINYEYLSNASANFTINIELNEDAFSYYDDKQQKWVLESGKFTIAVGSSSRDIRVSGDVEL